MYVPQPPWGGHDNWSGTDTGWLLITMKGQKFSYKELRCLYEIQTFNGFQWKFGLENVQPSGPRRSSSSVALSQWKCLGKWKPLACIPGKLVVQISCPWQLSGARSPKSVASEVYGAPVEANEKQVVPYSPAYPAGGMLPQSRLQASLTGKQDSH